MTNMKTKGKWKKKNKSMGAKLANTWGKFFMGKIYLQ
jgi:hypothetical protein